MFYFANLDFFSLFGCWCAFLSKKKKRKQHISRLLWLGSWGFNGGCAKARVTVDEEISCDITLSADGLHGDGKVSRSMFLSTVGGWIRKNKELYSANIALLIPTVPDLVLQRRKHISTCQWISSHQSPSHWRNRSFKLQTALQLADDLCCRLPLGLNNRMVLVLHSYYRHCPHHHNRT